MYIFNKSNHYKINRVDLYFLAEETTDQYIPSTVY